MKLQTNPKLWSLINLKVIPQRKLVKTIKYNNVEYMGIYFHMNDTIEVNRFLAFKYPEQFDNTILHESIHATGAAHRLNRIDKLEKLYNDEYKDNSKSYRTEELIAEIATSVFEHRAGLLGYHGKYALQNRLMRYYDGDIFVPWDDVISAVNYIKQPYVDLTESISHLETFIKNTLEMRVMNATTHQTA